MSPERRQDFARPPGPQPERKRNPIDAAHGPQRFRVEQLRMRFAATFGNEPMILEILKQLSPFERLDARIALSQALGGHYTGGNARAIALCEQVFGQGAVDFPSERIDLEASAQNDIVEKLSAEGKNIKKLPEDHSLPGRKADAEVDGVSTEFKKLDPGATDATVKNDISSSIKRGGQARQIVIDARGSGLTESAAEKGLIRAKGISRGRLDIVRILGDGFDLTHSF